MKKFTASLLALCMVLMLLGGCVTVPAGIDESNQTGTNESVQTSTSESVPEESSASLPEDSGTSVPEDNGESVPEDNSEKSSYKEEYSDDHQFSIGLPENEGISVDFGSPTAKPSSLPVENQTIASQTGAPVQLTIEDIQAMNGDDLVIDIYRNNGYLSTLWGKFYEGKVMNAEDGVEAAKGMATLLGLTKGCEFFAVYGETDNNGYTYYTYQQRYGLNTMQYATLRIIVDPDGYTAGLTCSFVPNIGTASQEAKITAQQAEQIISQALGAAYPIIAGKTVQLAVMFNNIVYNCWVVYTNNPDVSASFDMPYYANYVSTDGDYLISIPANTFATSNKDTTDNEEYFRGLDTQDVTFTIAQPAGGTKTISVPISRNPKDGKYYLMDPARKIAVAGYKEFAYQGQLAFVSSESMNSGWSDLDLMAYYNYINAYDFYADHGIRSIDGFEVPLLITVGYCDEQGNPVDNACYYGINSGWGCFAAATVNNYSYCADVCAHEFTHGITSNSMQGIWYQNETGAINEAYSDIMGNLCEKITGETSDTGWLIAESSGDGQMRDMADPNRFEQPAFVGDEYYVPSVLAPSNYNDNGGVHLNNTLTSRLAALLDREGMSLEQQFKMWITSIEMITPKSDYEDLHAILLASLKINGMLQQYGPTVNKVFAEEGLDVNWNESYLEATKSGCGRLTFQTDGYIASKPSLCFFATQDGNIVASGYPDRNGTVSVLLPAGSYICLFEYAETDLNNPSVAYYDGSGWTTSQTYAAFTVTNGGSTMLPTLNSGKNATAGGNSGGGIGDSGGSGGTASTEGTELNLVSYNGGYFTMLIPEGWRVDVAGNYGGTCYRIYDPGMPGRQVFFYGALAPYHKSEQSRRYLSYYDTTGGIISNGPVLTSADVQGIADCWQYTIDFQKRYDGRQLFPTLNQIQFVDVENYQGPYYGYGPETVGIGTCYDESGNPCIVGMAGALVDLDFYGYYGGNWYYTLYGLMGITCPYEEFDLYLDDMMTCVCSLQFSQDYIDISQNTSWPLVDNDTLADNLETIAGVIVDLYDEVVE